MSSKMDANRPISSADFREIIGSFASGVTVITTVHDGVLCGATASAVSSLSLDPPMMLVCLNRQAATSKAVSASMRFVVNILAEDQPDIAMRFASSSGSKFDGLPVDFTPWGGPSLPQALANIDCRVVEQVSAGTHTVFIAEIESATRKPGAPLAYFRGKFGRMAMEQDELAYHEIRERLMRRAVPIGMPLNMDGIADELGVPRGSAYYSLARCAAEGLVDRDANGSFVVPAVTLDALLDALTALFGIWLGAMQLTIGKLSTAQLDELHVLLAALKPPGDEVQVWTSWDFLKARGQFVEAFLRATGSVTMQEAFARADVQSMVAYCWSEAGALQPSEYEQIYGGFSQVLNAAQAGDAGMATEAIRNLHLRTRTFFEASFLKRHSSIQMSA